MSQPQVEPETEKGFKNNPKVKEKELPGMPPKSALSIEVEKFLAAREEVETKNHNLELCREAVIEQMKITKIFSITVEGKIVEYRHSEGIAVRKGKE